MRKIFVLASIAFAGIAGLVILSTADPASVDEYEYCLQDHSSHMRQCFVTMEKCVVMIPGRGGSCAREPYLAEASASYAYPSKRHDRPQAQQAD